MHQMLLNQVCCLSFANTNNVVNRIKKKSFNKQLLHNMLTLWVHRDATGQHLQVQGNDSGGNGQDPLGTYFI